MKSFGKGFFRSLSLLSVLETSQRVHVPIKRIHFTLTEQEYLKNKYSYGTYGLRHYMPSSLSHMYLLGTIYVILISFVVQNNCIYAAYTTTVLESGDTTLDS